MYTVTFKLNLRILNFLFTPYKLENKQNFRVDVQMQCQTETAHFKHTLGGRSKTESELASLFQDKHVR